VDDAGSKNETEKTRGKTEKTELGNKILPYSRQQAKLEALREWRVIIKFKISDLKYSADN
jgi:hypothetical protein